LFSFKDPQVMKDMIAMFVTCRNQCMYGYMTKPQLQTMVKIFKNMHDDLDNTWRVLGTNEAQRATLLRHLFAKLYLYEWSFMRFDKKSNKLVYLGYEEVNKIEPALPHIDDTRERLNNYAFSFYFGNAYSMFYRMSREKMIAPVPKAPFIAPIDEFAPTVNKIVWSGLVVIGLRHLPPTYVTIPSAVCSSKNYTEPIMGLMEIFEPELYKQMNEHYDRLKENVKKLSYDDPFGYHMMARAELENEHKTNSYVIRYKILDYEKNHYRKPKVELDIKLHDVKLKAAAGVKPLKIKSYPRKKMDALYISDKVSSKDFGILSVNYAGDHAFAVYAANNEDYKLDKAKYLYELSAPAVGPELFSNSVKVNDAKLKLDKTLLVLYKEFCNKGFTDDGVNFRKCKFTMAFLHPELRAVFIKYFSMIPNVNPMYILSSFHLCLDMSNDENDDDLYMPNFDDIIHPRRTINKMKSGVTLILNKYYSSHMVRTYEYCSHYASIARASMEGIKLSTKCTYSYIFRNHQSLSSDEFYRNTKHEKLKKLASLLSEKTVDLTITKSGKGAVFRTSSFDVDSFDEYMKQGQETVNMLRMVEYYTNVYAELLQDCLNMPITEALILEYAPDVYLKNESVTEYLRIMNSKKFEEMSKSKRISQLSWDQMLYSFHQAAVHMSGNLIKNMMTSKVYSTALLTQYLSKTPIHEALYYSYMVQMTKRLNEAIDEMNIKKLERSAAKFAEAIEQLYKPVAPYKAILSSEKQFFVELEALKIKQDKLSKEADALKKAINAKKLVNMHDVSKMSNAEKKAEKARIDAMAYDEYRKLRVECNDALKYVETVRKMFPETSNTALTSVMGIWKGADFDITTFEDLLRERETVLIRSEADLLMMKKKANPTNCEITEDQKDNKSMSGMVASVPGLSEFCSRWQKIARHKIPLANYMIAYQCVMSMDAISRHKLPTIMKRGDWHMLLNAMCRYYVKEDLVNLSPYNMKRVGRFMEKPVGPANSSGKFRDAAADMLVKSVNDMLKGKYQTALMFASLQRAKYIMSKYIGKHELYKKLLKDPLKQDGAPWRLVEKRQRRSLMAVGANEVLEVD
jgi:hypothetical protein